MSSVLTVLGFGWKYLRRYWVRLVAGLVFSILFGLSNASFIGATRTLTERLSTNVIAEATNEIAEAGSEHPPAAGTSPHKLQTLKDRAKAATDQIKARAQRAIEQWLPKMGRPLTTQQIVGFVLFLPLLVGIRGAANYLSSYCMGWVGERSIRDLRRDLAEKLLGLSLDFFNRSTTGDLLTRINTDSQHLLRAWRQGAADLVKESMTVVAVLIGMLWLDWKLTLCAMIVLPLCAFPLFVLGKKARRASTRSIKASVAQSSQLVELVNGIRVIKAFNLEEEEMKRFRNTSAELVYAGMKGVQAKELVNPILEVLSMVGLGGLFLYIFITQQSGADVVGVLTGVALFFLPIKKLAGLHIIFEQAGVAAARLIEILNEQPTVMETAQPRRLSGFRSRIEFERITFGFGEKVVLRDFSLAIPRGLRLGLAGESGSGKTTIVNLLYRFYDPQHGSVKIDGLNLRDLSIHELRQQMALVSQDIVIFDQTVADNIACGRAGATRPEIEAAARAAFAHDFIMQLPEGYDTRAGERGVTLSGGQRQRICIARAFVRDAPILILDEATAALDAKAEGEVQAAIDRLAEHRTVICVAHRLSTLATMDRIVVIKEGRIVETGAFDELLQAGGPFAEMARRQGIFAAAARSA